MIFCFQNSNFNNVISTVLQISHYCDTWCLMLCVKNNFSINTTIIMLIAVQPRVPYNKMLQINVYKLYIMYLKEGRKFI